MHTLVQSLLDLSSALGHWGVFLLMIIESSFIPFPSELVVPPAAYLAYKGEMNIWLVMIAGVAGSLVGAVINYAIARTLGRAVIYGIAKRRFMRYLLITHHKLVKAEQFFLKYGNISTFVGRLIIGVRQLISLPAGFAKMPFGAFCLYTTLGAAVWVPVLAMHGYLLAANEEWVKAYFTELSIGVGAVVVLIAVGIFWLRKRK